MPQWMHVILGQEMIDNMSFVDSVGKTVWSREEKNSFFLFLPAKLLLILKSKFFFF